MLIRFFQHRNEQLKVYMILYIKLYIYFFYYTITVLIIFYHQFANKVFFPAEMNSLEYMYITVLYIYILHFHFFFIHSFHNTSETSLSA